MFEKLFAFMARKSEPEPAEEPEEDKPRRDAFSGTFSTHSDGMPIKQRLAGLKRLAPRLERPDASAAAPGSIVAAMDAEDAACEQGMLDAFDMGQPNISGTLADWYGAQTFLGHQLAGIVAQHWLIAKVCDMPGRDAIRHGFEITASDGKALDPVVLSKIKRADKKFKLKKNLREFINFGRVFGIRICIFDVNYGDRAATDAAYEAPFNIDGVRPGAYRGMIQVDPYWCSPELDAKASAQANSMHFYEPTWWLINGRRYHRSHLCIYRHGSVADILKPSYLYGGVPVPQLIMERVYGAERTANEAPLLALTKRTVVYKVDMAEFVTKLRDGLRRVRDWAMFWSNNGVRVIDTNEEHQQIDTSLADMDTVIMTQYQLVASAGGVPATKLLGTAAKGMNATGEGDESNYHEELESLQEHELTPMVERHHQLTLRSEMPDVKGVDTTISWEPLDSPTAIEWAEINLKKAQTAVAYGTLGTIDGHDERIRLVQDKNSGYGMLVVDAPIDESETAVAVKAGVSPLGTPAATVEAQK
jgi:hypothetical protein